MSYQSITPHTDFGKARIRFVSCSESADDKTVGCQETLQDLELSFAVFVDAVTGCCKTEESDRPRECDPRLLCDKHDGEGDIDGASLSLG